MATQIRANTTREKVGSRVTLFRTPASPMWHAEHYDRGRQFRRSLRTHSLKQARALAQKIDAEIVLGQHNPQRHRARLADAVEQYLTSVRGRGRQPGTLEFYQRDLRQFVAFAAEQRAEYLDEVTARLLEEYEERLSKQGPPVLGDVDKDPTRQTRPNGPKTIRNRLKNVRQLIRWALKRRLVREDPAPGYELPRESESDRTVFSPEELAAILAEPDPLYRDVFDFLRLTGLRSGEVCWLTRDDIDLDGRVVRVRPKACPVTGMRWIPKHGRGRVVPLCGPALEIARRAPESSTAPWLFPAPEGRRPGRLTPNRIHKALARRLRQAGIERGTIHTLRHVYCTFMASQGVDPFKLMRYLGHRKLDTVLTYYSPRTEDLQVGLEDVDFARMLPGEADDDKQEPRKPPVGAARDSDTTS